MTVKRCQYKRDYALAPWYQRATARPEEQEAPAQQSAERGSLPGLDSKQPSDLSNQIVDVDAEVRFQQRAIRRRAFTRFWAAEGSREMVNCREFHLPLTLLYL